MPNQPHSAYLPGISLKLPEIDARQCVTRMHARTFSHNQQSDWKPRRVCSLVAASLSESNAIISRKKSRVSLATVTPVTHARSASENLKLAQR